MLHQLIGGIHILLFIGFQPSFWWCRISSIHSINKDISTGLTIFQLGQWICPTDMNNRWLIGGIPTPLKNDGVRQLGWLFHSQLFLESHKSHVPNHQPGYISWYPHYINLRSLIRPTAMPAMPAMAILPQLGGCRGRVESSGAGQRVAGPSWKETIG